MRTIRTPSAITAGRSRAARITACASLAVGLMAGVSVVAAAGASAATFTCTGNYPEVCLGFNSAGEQAQVDINYGVSYEWVFTAFDSTGVMVYFKTESEPTTTAPGWQVPPVQIPSISGAVEYCAYVGYQGTVSGQACIP